MSSFKALSCWSWKNVALYGWAAFLLMEQRSSMHNANTGCSVQRERRPKGRELVPSSYCSCLVMKYEFWEGWAQSAEGHLPQVNMGLDGQHANSWKRGLWSWHWKIDSGRPDGEGQATLFKGEGTACTEAQKHERVVHRGNCKSILTSFESRLRFHGKWQAEMPNELSEFEITKDLIKHTQGWWCHWRIWHRKVME